MLISISELTFSYPGSHENVFENVSFQIDSNWKLGLIGRNGRGKTTFLNILRGKLDYSGSVSSDIQFDYFPFDVKNKEDFTIDVIRNIAIMAEDWEIYREASLIGLDDDVMYRSFSTLSNGEQVKSMLVALFIQSDKFLLIDEPTNHLDVDSRESVKEYLSSKKGFILVSHDRDLLDGCVDHILSINRSNIELQKGNYSSWYSNKTLQDEFELKKNEKLKKEIKRLEDSFAAKERWANNVEKSKIGGGTNSGSKLDRGYVGHKSAKAMQRAKNVESRQRDLIDEKSSLLKNIENSQPIKLLTLEPSRDVLLRMMDVSIKYGDKSVVEGINIELKRGDRLSIRGKNGSGKSSIIKAIMDVYNNKKSDFMYGDINIGSDIVISYIEQDTSNLSGSLDEFIYKNGIDEPLFKSILRKLDFSRDAFDYRIENMSEGQKKKVLLAKSISQRAHIYIWDEPLNYIDLISKLQIEEMILNYNPTMIFIEHDVVFNEKISNKNLIL